MELIAASSPVAPIPLRDARDDPAVVLDVVVTSKRELPADFWLERNVTLVVVHGHDVQRTTRPAMEVGSVEEDARVLHQSGDDFAVLLDARGAIFALGLELPLVLGETFGGALDSALVLHVAEMSAVTATTLDEFGRGLGEDALAAVAEDAGPIAFEERHVEHPGPLALRVVETHPFVGIGGD